MEDNESAAERIGRVQVRASDAARLRAELEPLARQRAAMAKRVERSMLPANLAVSRAATSPTLAASRSIAGLNRPSPFATMYANLEQQNQRFAKMFEVPAVARLAMGMVGESAAQKSMRRMFDPSDSMLSVSRMLERSLTKQQSMIQRAVGASAFGPSSTLAMALGSVAKMQTRHDEMFKRLVEPAYLTSLSGTLARAAQVPTRPRDFVASAAIARLGAEIEAVVEERPTQETTVVEAGAAFGFDEQLVRRAAEGDVEAIERVLRPMLARSARNLRAEQSAGGFDLNLAINFIMLLFALAGVYYAREGVQLAAQQAQESQLPSATANTETRLGVDATVTTGDCNNVVEGVVQGDVNIDCDDERDLAEQLDDLDRQRQRGVLTPAEFEAAKQATITSAGES